MVPTRVRGCRLPQTPPRPLHRGTHARTGMPIGDFGSLIRLEWYPCAYGDAETREGPEPPHIVVPTRVRGCRHAPVKLSKSKGGTHARTGMPKKSMQRDNEEQWYPRAYGDAAHFVSCSCFFAVVPTRVRGCRGCRSKQFRPVVPTRVRGMPIHNRHLETVVRTCVQGCQHDDISDGTNSPRQQGSYSERRRTDNGEQPQITKENFNSARN